MSYVDYLNRIKHVFCSKCGEEDEFCECKIKHRSRKFKEEIKDLEPYDEEC
jgi:hypothetical protein